MAAPDFKEALNNAIAAKKAAQQQLDQLDSQRKQDQKNIAHADYQIKLQPRRAKAEELWNGKGVDGQGGARVKADQMVRRGQQGYDNYVAAMGSIVELSVALGEALAADLKLDIAIPAVIGGVVGTAWDVTKGTAGLVMNPSQTAESIAKLRRQWFSGGMLDGLSGQGETLKLPEEVIQASVCSNDGRLTFKPLNGVLPPNTMQQLIDSMETLHQQMVCAFLLNKGYSCDATQVWTDASGKIKLDATTFENLKQDPSDGLAVFAQKKQAIQLTKEPLSYAGGRDAKLPEISAPEPEPKPSIFSPRPR